MSPPTRADPAGGSGAGTIETLAGGIDTATIPVAADVLEEVAEFLAQPPEAMRPPRKLRDCVLAVVDRETGQDALLFAALDRGDLVAAEDLLRRRAAFASGFDALADRAAALAAHFDELPFRPSVGALRREQVAA